MGTATIKLEFLSKFNIEGFFQSEKNGGQKAVHFIMRDGQKQVMKIFHGGKDLRFEREMKIYEKFKHSDGLPRIYETSEYEGETIVFEQFIDGNPLDDICGTYKKNNETISKLLQNLFSILAPIWKENYVHRDIKPANIIIKPDGLPVLLDFGIARDLSDSSITGTGGLQPGTWKWASPEQYAGEKDMISYRTDFFSLGVVAYNLFHQQLPFGDTPDLINTRFKSGDETFIIDNDCSFKNFLTESMRFKPSQRPKDIDDLIKLIPL